MPIRPENRARYPRNWPAISRAVRDAAQWQCEWCEARDGGLHPETGSRVVLTVAHLDHQPENCARENLVALCQRCHNEYDRPMRLAGRKARRRASLACGDLFEERR